MNRVVWQCPVVLFVFVTAVWAQEAARPEQQLTFENHVRPIFKVYCLDCHGAEDELKGGLDLRLRRFIIKGGDSGPAIELGNAEDSYLYQRIRDGEMPPRDKKPSAKDLDTIAKWIAASAPTARGEPREIGKGIRITPGDREFWAFQPIRKPEVPVISNPQRIRTPIDAFIERRMKLKGLAFSSDAGEFTLLRRATLDLTGLPPSVEDIARFLGDNSEGAYERLVDRLLSSRHYGERWGRHWLDVAGYADSEGYTTADQVRGFAYKYRDYVIRSFNSDRPFDQFIVEQIAGDELVSPPYEDFTPDETEKLVATGFLRMAVDGTGSGAPDQDAARNQVIGDTMQIVSSALLGMSLGCAQCHDHRHDPILQSDYYRIRAIFEPALDWKNWRVPSQRRISLYTAADRAAAAAVGAEAGKVAAERAQKQTKYIAEALDKELEKFDESLRESYRVAYYTPADKRTAEQKQIFRENPFLRLHGGNLYQYNQAAADDLKKDDARIAGIRGKKPAEDFVRVLTEVPGKIPTTYLFHRGDPKRPSQPVAPGGLTITAPEGEQLEIPPNDPNRPSTGRRLAYARWLTNGRHPLVARVLVNRVWMHHFGRGLVDTPSDFGSTGGRPSHPELLDWLASEFVDRGWSMKWLHKLVMTSTVYRQDSRRDPARDAIDPGNLLYWHKPIQRLEAETIRDRILAASGTLNGRMFGPPVSVREDEVGQIIVGSDPKGSEAHRRSVYVQVRRSMPVSFLRQFDMPDMAVNCAKRSTSTLSTQSLMLMNSDFILDQAEQLARRVIREGGETRRDQAVHAWQLALSRPPTDEEITRSLTFLDQQTSRLNSIVQQQDDAAKETTSGDQKKDEPEEKQEIRKLEPELQALTNLCQALLGSSEFLYVD